MIYREPTAGLLARIAELEHELWEVRDEQRRAGAGFFGRLLGAALRVEVEQVLPVEIASERYDRIVELLQRRFDAQGQFLVVGRSWHWTLMTARSQRDLSVSVVVRDGTTSVRAIERFKDTLGMCFAWAFLVVMPLGMAIPALLQPGRLALLTIWLVLGFVALVCVRVSYAMIVRRRAGQLRATVHELTRLSVGGQ